MVTATTPEKQRNPAVRMRYLLRTPRPCRADVIQVLDGQYIPITAGASA
jgi:hypothetical protein